MSDELNYYAIVSIDDSREITKANIREHVEGFEVNNIGYCDARLGNNMKFPLELTTKWTLTRAEQAIWHSMANCWDWAATNDKPLLVFEDDAIIDQDFQHNFDYLRSCLPEDWDFMSLWVPPNQEQDYFYNVTYDDEGTPDINGRLPNFMSYYNFDQDGPLANVYQGYSYVCTYYSPTGAAKILELALERGMYTPADCFLFLMAHSGRLNGYAPKPTYPRFIWHDDSRPSLKGI